MRECEEAEALLSVLTVVWHHHGEGPEESLQVVRELSAAGVPGVHGDKDSTCSDELDLSTLEHEPLHLMGWVGREGVGQMCVNVQVNITGVIHSKRTCTYSI